MFGYNIQQKLFSDIHVHIIYVLYPDDAICLPLIGGLVGCGGGGGGDAMVGVGPAGAPGPYMPPGGTVL